MTNLSEEKKNTVPLFQFFYNSHNQKHQNSYTVTSFNITLEN